MRGLNALISIGIIRKFYRYWVTVNSGIAVIYTNLIVPYERPSPPVRWRSRAMKRIYE